MLTVIISEFLKNTIRRPRPPKSSISKRALPIRDDVCNPAFPSGDSGQVTVFLLHHLQAAVFSAFLYLFFEKRILFLLLPLPTMFGRVYYGAHWIGDTIGGVLIGYVVTFFLSHQLFKWAELVFGNILPACLFR